MKINSYIAEPRTVDDYDIIFDNGVMLPITIDRNAGDTVDTASSPLTTIFHIAEKPSITDPKLTLPAADVTIFMSHVITITHRQRIIVPVTPDQRDEFQKTLVAMSGTIN